MKNDLSGWRGVNVKVVDTPQDKRRVGDERRGDAQSDGTPRDKHLQIAAENFTAPGK